MLETKSMAQRPQNASETRTRILERQVGITRTYEAQERRNRAAPGVWQMPVSALRDLNQPGRVVNSGILYRASPLLNREVADPFRTFLQH